MSTSSSSTSSSNASHQPDLIGRFAEHRVAANLLMMLMLISGIMAISKLNTQFLPTFDIDYITVRVIWPGASAEDIASSITTPLEKELRNLDDVKEMRSVSTLGLSNITLEYQEDTDMGLALDQVKEYVSLVRNLPPDAEEPEITKIVRNENVADVIVTAQGNLDELRPLVYRFEQELLNRGIAKIEFTGLPEQEIAIQVSSRQLQALQMSLPQIGERVISQSQDIPAGTSGKNEVAQELRSLEKRRTEQGFRELPILTDRNGQMITLDDIATIEQRPRSQQTAVFYQGNPAVVMQLQRVETADTLVNARILHEWIEDTRPTLPPGVEVELFNEAYELVQDRINLLLKNGITGLLLVICILFIFLNGQVAFWVTVGIPISFMGTLAVLYLSGGSLNMVTLFALIMALGIIVDDAIVVAEDALSHYQTGENSLAAAEGGARRMLVPVLSSSMTTIAAFMPLMLIGDIIGTILSAIPLVVICVIIASLVECFLILPGHLRHSFHRNHHRKPSPLRARLDNGFNRFRERIFRPFALAALQNRLTTLTVVFAVMLVAIGIVAGGHMRFTFFPSPDGTIIVGAAKFTAGTPPDEVAAYGDRLSETLQQTSEALQDGDVPVVVNALVTVGGASFNGGRDLQRGDQYVMLQAELISPDAREATNSDFIAAWKTALGSIPGLETLSITATRGGPPGDDIDIFVSGSDTTTLKQIAAELSDQLERFDGVSNIQDDLPYGRQQLIYNLTPTGRALGLTVQEVGRQLRAALDGEILQVFYNQKDDIEVRILLPDAERDYQRTLQTLPIIAPNGRVAPLSNIVTFEARQGLELLRHTDGELGVHVTAVVDARKANANNILAKLSEEAIPDLVSRYDVTVDFRGRAEEQRETGADMRKGALLALMLIYFILAWIFSSYFWPLAVMIVIPFGLAGAIFGHLVMGLDLTIVSLWGFFGLSGIVINDSIILITFYRQLRQQGMERSEAILEASCQRLRAVLLTSLTTIGGLTPLLFETSRQAQFLIPMAVSISFGLMFSTLLVLIVVPVLLSLLEQWRPAEDEVPLRRETKTEQESKKTGQPVDNLVKEF